MSDLEVSAANILGERGMRYKRNALAASLIATVLFWTDAPLGEVSLFGVSLSNVEDKEAAAWMIFFAILSYQWIMLAYYGRRDWRNWQQQIVETFNFSPWNIAFWMKEGAVMWENGAPTKLTVKKITTAISGNVWRARAPGFTTGRTVNIALQHNHRDNIRWRLIAFLTIEFGLPFLWSMVCLYLAMSKIVG